MRILNLTIIGFILLGYTAVFAEGIVDTNMAAETFGYIAQGDGQISILYPSEINLKKLEARLRSRYFSVSSTEKDLFTNPGYSIENRIIARLESILLRVEQILAMHPNHMEITIKIFATHQELNDEYYRQFGTTGDYRSFYIHALGTIYSSMQDISDSVISHEMAHAVVDNYFRVMPPEKTAELLATYVDSHLERE